MNISIIGTGYVGLVTGACLADFGMQVLCMDMDEEKINMLKYGIIPIYEPGLEKLVENNVCNTGRLKFTSDIKEAVDNSDVIFIAVGTPALDDGTSDLGSLFCAIRSITLHMDCYKAIITKSTVPLGTGRRIQQEIKNILLQRNKTVEFDVVSNPEFLREGSAVADFVNPDRIVIGAENERALKIVKKIYEMQIKKGIPLVITDIKTAEMIKYASNAFLASKISFINEIAVICELCGANAVTVSRAMGLDHRIGAAFLNPGPGYGGSCFPKDLKAMLGMGRSLGYIPKIIKSTIDVNHNQINFVIQKIKKYLFEAATSTVTVLGLSFKPGTDDIRDSPAIPIIRSLLDLNARIKVYDPKAAVNMKKQHPELEVHYCSDPYSASEGSDCIILVTEWEEVCNLDFNKLKLLVASPVFLDLRNVYDPDYVKGFGFIYEGVGRK